MPASAVIRVCDSIKFCPLSVIALLSAGLLLMRMGPAEHVGNVGVSGVDKGMAAAYVKCGSG